VYCLLRIISFDNRGLSESSHTCVIIQNANVIIKLAICQVDREPYCISLSCIVVISLNINSAHDMVYIHALAIAIMSLYINK